MLMKEKIQPIPWRLLKLQWFIVVPPKHKEASRGEKSIYMAEAIPFGRELFLRVELAINSPQVTFVTVGELTHEVGYG